MLISIERRVAHPSHQFMERRVTGKIRSQHKGVDKIPDQALDLETVSIRDGGSYHDIGLTRVSMEQGLERRQHGHEQRNVLLLTQVEERPVKRRLQREAVRRSHETGFVGSRPVSWQSQCREVR